MTWLPYTILRNSLRSPLNGAKKNPTKKCARELSKCRCTKYLSVVLIEQVRSAQGSERLHGYTIMLYYFLILLLTACNIRCRSAIGTQQIYGNQQPLFPAPDVRAWIASVRHGWYYAVFSDALIVIVGILKGANSGSCGVCVKERFSWTPASRSSTHQCLQCYSTSRSKETIMRLRTVDDIAK